MKKRNILFLFIGYPENKNDSNLPKDLADEFVRQGDGVFVATIRERKLGLKTSDSFENNRRVLRIRSGNMFNTVSKFEKAFSMLTMNQKIYSNIKKHWGNIEFDLIVGSTPYTAHSSLILGLKKHFKCPAFLILWDIFPQNARDLGIIKNKYLFEFFKRREIKSLLNFDHIGCMTDGNLEYIKKNYPFISHNKLTIFPLWGNKKTIKNDLSISREKLGFDTTDFILVFGGNMGLPQNLPNIINLANEVKHIKDIKFLFVGDGTEVKKIRDLTKEFKLSNVKFLNKVERTVYEDIMLFCDVGLVSLSPKFTVPNFPSKTMDYIKYNLPILASLDQTALMDYGYFIEEKLKIGLCSHAENMTNYKENLFKLYKNRDLYDKFSGNCQNAFDKKFNIKTNYESIITCL